MKFRSMACLMKPAQFKERTLSDIVQRDRFINGYTVREIAQKTKQRSN